VGTFAAFTDNSSTYVTLTDERDGKVYPVVKIANRWIMARNLNYQEGLTWQANADQPSNTMGQNLDLIGHFWCPGGSSDETPTSTRASCDVWGAMYSWETAMSFDGKGGWTESPSTYNSGAANSAAAKANHGRTASGSGRGGRGICPLNWHVPTEHEWGIILDGMESGGGTAHQNASGAGATGADAGTRGKSKCTVADNGTAGGTYVSDTQTNWYYNSGTLGTDDYGFRVLPSGFRGDNGISFNSRGYVTFIWSSSLRGETDAWCRGFAYQSNPVFRQFYVRSSGLPVRCIRN
jgi:uncharacterized protein (TIGR02145 family)